jgi:murein DD-endopeptidase MepM/ murein hydrolase activator NlpD
MKPLLTGLGLLLLALLGLGGLFTASLLTVGGGADAVQPSAAALADIPAEVLRDYQDAARACPGLSWTVLAGIGKVESDHGRSQLPGVHSGQNQAGAEGPMQFLQATWEAFHLPGLNDVYDVRDAAFAAARYLCANGAAAAERLRQAVFAYNHAWWYVDEVLAWAGRYAADTTQADVAGGMRPGDPFAGACHPAVTQPYGPTDFTAEPVLGGVHFHTGIDLACAEGVPVRSLTEGLAHVTSGCVVGAEACGGGWGNSVVVEVVTRLAGDLGPQHYFVRYAHLDGVVLADGALVHAGDLLGFEGATGLATGPHLHFEVDRGAASIADSINPAPLLEVS